jgi:hypothetical protein
VAAAAAAADDDDDDFADYDDYDGRCQHHRQTDFCTTNTNVGLIFVEQFWMPNLIFVLRPSGAANWPKHRKTQA